MLRLFSYSLIANELANAVVDLTRGIGGITGAKRSEDHEEGHDDGTEDHHFAENGAGVAEFRPLHAALAEVLLKLLSSELVENETPKGNAVAESLEECDRILEQEHGGEDKENILENTREGKDERRGLADLRIC